MTFSLWEQRLKGAVITAVSCGLVALLFGVRPPGSALIAVTGATLWSLTTIGPTDTGRAFPVVFLSRAHGARPELSRLHTGNDRLLKRLRVLAVNRLADVGIDAFESSDSARVTEALGPLAHRLLLSGEPPSPRRSDIARCVAAVEHLATLRDPEPLSPHS